MRRIKRAAYREIRPAIRGQQKDRVREAMAEQMLPQTDGIGRAVRWYTRFDRPGIVLAVDAKSPEIPSDPWKRVFLIPTDKETRILTIHPTVKKLSVFFPWGRDFSGKLTIVEKEEDGEAPSQPNSND